MTRAYPETYLNSAMGKIADLFDLAINLYRMEPDTFAGFFACSKTCFRLENGDPALLLGKSGPEIAFELLNEEAQIHCENAPDSPYGRTPEYWAGWVAAFYQWRSGITFRELFQNLPLSELLALYPAMHEADVTKAADAVDARLQGIPSETNLGRIRHAYGCSQRQLAKAAGVSLRSIQMYEQRNKDINKAQAETLLRLARALGCQIEDLLETV